MPPVPDELVDILAIWGQEQEVPPLVVADVQATVLIHPVERKKCVIRCRENQFRCGSLQIDL